MDRAHAGALTVERAADLHQAGIVGRRADLGAGVEDAAQLVAEHRHRGVGVLDRERAAEAAAFLARRGSSTRSIPRTARSSRSGASPTGSSAERVAGRVVGHAVRVIGADILDAQLLDQELRQLEHARHQCDHRRASAASPSVSARLRRKAADVDARCRWRDDHLGVPERLDKVAHQRDGLALIAGVEVHLATAGLLEREIDRRGRAAPAAAPSRGRSGEDRVVEQVMNSATRTGGSSSGLS